MNNILLPEVDHHFGWSRLYHGIITLIQFVLTLTRCWAWLKGHLVFQTRLVSRQLSFNALVIPILEYACPVWNTYLGKHTKTIEKIQRRASRLIWGSDKEYPERLLELKWESSELRRKYLSLVQMYKIIFGYCDINCHHYFDIIGITRTRSKHEYKIRPKVTRANYFKYSFFYRYINDWNSLPSNVMSSPSLQSFKVSLIKYFRS